MLIIKHYVMIEYNYDFLREWFDRTGTTYRDVMRAVGNSSANNLHDWIGDGPAQERQRQRGEQVRPVPMNVISMVRFCNHFDIPLLSFFCKDGKSCCENDNMISDTQTEIIHLREVSLLKDEARMREDSIRSEYKARLLQRERELRDIIRMKDEEIQRLKGE